MAFTLSACAPDASDRTVTLEPLTPEARADRDAQLQGTAPRRTLATVPGAAGGAARVTGGPADPPAASSLAPPVATVRVRDVPRRPAGETGNVVAFALATTHPIGQAVYGREAPSETRRERACARYVSDDLAQQAFLEAGGPQADPRGMDPDGDGYACGWDPTRFRRAVE